MLLAAPPRDAAARLAGHCHGVQKCRGKRSCLEASSASKRGVELLADISAPPNSTAIRALARRDGSPTLQQAASAMAAAAWRLSIIASSNHEKFNAMRRIVAVGAAAPIAHDIIAAAHIALSIVANRLGGRRRRKCMRNRGWYGSSPHSHHV